MEHWKERNTKWNGTVKRIEENDQGLRNLIVDSVVFNPEVGQNLAPLHAHWISALSLNSCLRKIVAQGVHLDVDSASLLLHSVSSHPTLKTLCLSHNEITDGIGKALVKVLEESKGLAKLDLTANPISEKLTSIVLPAIRRNFTLISLEIDSIQLPSELIVGSLPKNVEEVVDLFECLASNDDLRLCRLKRKDSLSFRNRTLTILPKFGSSMLHVTTLNLSRNDFVEFPAEILHLMNLQNLSLRHNKLTKISPQINCLSQLKVLDLSYNRLESLPPSVGFLYSLETLDLSNNLIHSLPYFLGSLPRLQYLLIEGNTGFLQPALFSLSPVDLARLIRSQNSEEVFLHKMKVMCVGEPGCLLIDSLANLKPKSTIFKSIFGKKKKKGKRDKEKHSPEMPPTSEEKSSMFNADVTTWEVDISDIEIPPHILSFHSLDQPQSPLVRSQSLKENRDKAKKLKLRLRSPSQSVEQQEVPGGVSPVPLMPYDSSPPRIPLDDDSHTDASIVSPRGSSPKSPKRGISPRLARFSPKLPRRLSPNPMRGGGEDTIPRGLPAGFLSPRPQAKSPQRMSLTLHPKEGLAPPEGGRERVQSVSVPAVNYWDTLQYSNVDPGSKPRQSLTLIGWDLGQANLNAQQLLFLASRAIYLVAFNLRTVEQDPFRLEYWLQAIQVRAPNAPIILVGFHTTKTPRSFLDKIFVHLNERFAARFPKIRFFLPYDGSRVTLEELQVKLTHLAMDVIWEEGPIPRAVLALGEKFEGLKEMYVDKPLLTRLQFESLAASTGIPQKFYSNALYLLTQVASVMHFNETALMNVIVVDAMWLWELLDSVSKLDQTKGILVASDFEAIWTPPKFPKELYSDLLGLLEKFELAYKLPPSMQRNISNRVLQRIKSHTNVKRHSILRKDSDKVRVLVPSLLPEDPSLGILEALWPSKPPRGLPRQPELARHYHFEFMPLGFFSVIMARVLHTGWRLKEVWRNGMLLAFEGHVSRVELNESDFALRIHVRGPQCHKLLLTLVSCIENIINEWLHVSVGINVPCIHCLDLGEPDPFSFRLEDLEEAVANGKTVVKCRDHPVSIYSLAPDISLGGFDHIKINPEDLVIEETIAQTEQSSVLKGTYKNELVAVKEIHGIQNFINSHQARTEIFQQFRREVWLMSGLSDPNIVQLVGVTLKPMALVMEYMELGTLYDFIHSGIKINWKTRIVLALDIARGVMFLHSITPPIIHRDLKSPNILLKRRMLQRDKLLESAPEWDHWKENVSFEPLKKAPLRNRSFMFTSSTRSLSMASVSSSMKDQMNKVKSRSLKNLAPISHDRRTTAPPGVPVPLPSVAPPPTQEPDLDKRTSVFFNSEVTVYSTVGTPKGSDLTESSQRDFEESFSTPMIEKQKSMDDPNVQVSKLPLAKETSVPSLKMKFLSSMSDEKNGEVAPQAPRRNSFSDSSHNMAMQEVIGVNQQMSPPLSSRPIPENAPTSITESVLPAPFPKPPEILKQEADAKRQMYSELLGGPDDLADLMAKVTDFGLSVNSLSSSRVGRVVDCPLWLAPEVINGDPYNEKVDCYSLGVILWELLTQQIFLEEYGFAWEVEKAIVKGLRPSIPENCHPDYMALITRAWNAHPESRPSSREIVDKLESLAIEFGLEPRGKAVDFVKAREFLPRQLGNYESETDLNVLRKMIRELKDGYDTLEEKRRAESSERMKLDRKVAYQLMEIQQLETQLKTQHRKLEETSSQLSRLLRPTESHRRDVYAGRARPKVEAAFVVKGGTAASLQKKDSSGKRSPSHKKRPRSAVEIISSVTKENSSKSSTADKTKKPPSKLTRATSPPGPTTLSNEETTPPMKGHHTSSDSPTLSSVPAYIAEPAEPTSPLQSTSAPDSPATALALSTPLPVSLAPLLPQDPQDLQRTRPAPLPTTVATPLLDALTPKDRAQITEEILSSLRIDESGRPVFRSTLTLKRSSNLGQKQISSLVQQRLQVFEQFMESNQETPVVVNKKLAKQLGLNRSQSILAQTDRYSDKRLSHAPLIQSTRPGEKKIGGGNGDVCLDGGDEWMSRPPQFKKQATRPMIHSDIFAEQFLVLSPSPKSQETEGIQFPSPINSPKNPPADLAALASTVEIEKFSNGRNEKNIHPSPVNEKQQQQASLPPPLELIPKEKEPITEDAGTLSGDEEMGEEEVEFLMEGAEEEEEGEEKGMMTVEKKRALLQHDILTDTASDVDGGELFRRVFYGKKALVELMLEFDED